MKRWAQAALLSLVLGSLSGLACVAARWSFVGLQVLWTGHAGLLPAAAAQLPAWLCVLVPVLGGVCAWALGRKAPPGREYLAALRQGDGRIPLWSTAWHTLASAFSIATGAAIGREGSMIQFASALCSGCAHFVRKRVAAPPPATLLGYGVAGAVAAVYQAPVAGIFFAWEIGFGRQLPLRDALLLAVAAGAGWQVSSHLFEPGPLFPAPVASAWHLPTLFSALVLAAALGLLAPVYRWAIGSLSALSKLPLALAWGGLAVGLLSLRIPEVWGNGDGAIRELLGTAHPTSAAALSLLAARLLATAVCVGVGTVGGVFTPTVFAGCALAAAASSFVPGAAPVLMVAGIAALLAGTTRAPLMAAFMAVELTGRWPLVPLTLTAALLAAAVAGRVSSGSLYGIATTRPTRRV